VTRSPEGDLGRDIRRLELIRQAKEHGATWAAIGATLGTTGKEAKRDARRLAARVTRDLIAAKRAG
jgi:DNA-binding transcriptional MerR regulator